MLFRFFLTCAAATLMAQAPVISLDKVHHAFGRIPSDRRVVTVFHVTNKGNAYLSFSQVVASCGCTSATPGQWSLAPGESTDIQAVFDPRGIKGLARESIEVVSNDPKAPNLHLTLEADVVQEIMSSADSMVFHRVPGSSGARQEVRYLSGNGEPVGIQEVKAPGAPFLSFAHHAEGLDLVLEVTFDARKVPAGHSQGVETVSVGFTNLRVGKLPLHIQWDLK
jgi:hypothetical protein